MNRLHESESTLMMMMMNGNETDREISPEAASSTLLYDRIQRNKFNGSCRCLTLGVSIVLVFLLNFCVAVIASARSEHDILLCTIVWISVLPSLVVALVFVVKAEANALTQHNTYGFARAEIVGAVIVATFITGVTLESVLEVFEILFEKYEGFSDIECDSKRSKTARVSYPFKALVRWRSFNDVLLLHAFNLNFSTGLLYDGFQLIITFYDHRQTTVEEVTWTLTTPISVAAAPSNATAAAPSCQLWLLYLDRTSFALSHILILPFLIGLLRRSCLIVLQTVPPKFNADQLKEKLLSKVEGLTSVHEFHLWQLNANKIIVTLHVSCSREQSQAEYEKLREEITAFFHDEGIHSITVQPEFVDPEEDEMKPSCQLNCREEWSGPSCYKLQCCLEERPQLPKSQQTRLKVAADVEERDY